MRSVLVILTTLLVAAPAQAVMPATLLDRQLACFSDTDGTFTQESYLELTTDRGGLPAGYRYGEDFLERRIEGTWAEDGDGASFADGPLAGARLAVAPDGTTMPNDQIEGRTWPLVLGGAAARTWYCRSTRIEPRAAFADQAGWVGRRTGVPVRLPAAFDQGSLSFDLDGTPYSGFSARVRVATKGLWRLELRPAPCSGSQCGSLAIFSAKRAPYRQLLTLPTVRLAKGVRGRVGNVGCGPHPGPRNWGPVFCGRVVIVWHQGGINYAMEAPGADANDLIRYANQAIRTG